MENRLENTFVKTIMTLYGVVPLQIILKYCKICNKYTPRNKYFIIFLPPIFTGNQQEGGSPATPSCDRLVTI